MNKTPDNTKLGPIEKDLQISEFRAMMNEAAKQAAENGMTEDEINSANDPEIE